jgi:DNA-binding NarL/FixJ family response regulator
MRAEGIQSIPRGPRSATRRDPLGLTTREVDILAPLQHSLTNKEIAARLRTSPKTVDHHIGAVLAKLGVATRIQSACHPVARNLSDGR